MTSSEDSVLTLPAPPPDLTLRYGEAPQHFAHVRLPHLEDDRAASPHRTPHAAVMFIHGGYWRAKYDLLHAGRLCAALAARGLLTYSVEYRRVGDPGGGWPGTFADIRAACDHLHRSSGELGIDEGRIVVAGHSAGGHLALCLAGHDRRVLRAVSLAGVTDLHLSWALGSSNGAAAEFMGGDPAELPDDYQAASPLELTMPGVRQWLVHGDLDEDVPVEMARAYVARKRVQGEDVRYLELAGVGHFEIIDPASSAWPVVEELFLRATGTVGCRSDGSPLTSLEDSV